MGAAMLLGLWRFIKDRKNRELVSWLGGGAVVIVAGIWTVFVFFLNHDKKPGSSTATVVNPSGTVIAPGGDAVFHAPVSIGVDEKKVGQQIAEAQKPLRISSKSFWR
jgi:hypothetical protein